MTRHHFDPSELDRLDPDLERVAERLEQHAAETAGEPPMDLAARIQAAIEDEPMPAAGWWSRLGSWRRPVQAMAATAVLVAAIVGAVALGELAQRTRQDGFGSSPSPVVSPTPTPTPTPTPSPSPSAPLTPTPSPTASPTAEPTATDDDDDDDVETPEPSETDDDNSGPGGGDDDSSAPGSGDDDDSSGPGGD